MFSKCFLLYDANEGEVHYMNKQQSFFYISLVVILSVITGWIVTIKKSGVPYIDQWTRSIVESVADTKLYIVARWITELGSESFLIPFTVIMGIILIVVYRDWLPALLFSGGTLFSHLLNMWIKILVGRERPRIFIEANAEGFSFPSGHSMITMVCYGFLMYLLVKKVSSNQLKILIQISFSLLIFLIGISRFFINVHYITDIIAGFTFGFLILLGQMYLFEYIQKQRMLNKH